MEDRGDVPAQRTGYELEFEDTFAGSVLDRSHWVPHYLPQWGTREGSAARYEVGGGCLRLLIEADPPAWCPEFDGAVRVSSLQTGVFAGPLRSPTGQHRFHADLVVREEQENVRLYTPQYGLIEMRAKALDNARDMVALWMIGYEDERSVRRNCASVRSSDGTSVRGRPGLAWEFTPSATLRSSMTSRWRRFQSTLATTTYTLPHAGLHPSDQLLATPFGHPSVSVQAILLGAV